MNTQVNTRTDAEIAALANAQASLRATPNSFLVGLIGSGIGGSLTPAMHEEEGSKLGLHYVYRRITAGPDR